MTLRLERIFPKSRNPTKGITRIKTYGRREVRNVQSFFNKEKKEKISLNFHFMSNQCFLKIKKIKGFKVNFEFL